MDSQRSQGLTFLLTMLTLPACPASDGKDEENDAAKTAEVCGDYADFIAACHGEGAEPRGYYFDNCVDEVTRLETDYAEACASSYREYLVCLSSVECKDGMQDPLVCEDLGRKSSEICDSFKDTEPDLPEE